jgi:pyruvate,orthophosphate dikinase
MQMEAILCAMHKVQVTKKIESKVELMIPFTCEVKELQKIKSYIDQTIAKMETLLSQRFNIQVGTMIELPRAALTAAEIAPIVAFFSFGTNDLTQTTFGISRDDMGNFLPNYIAQKIFTCDPFTQIDEAGVGELIKIAINQGKTANPQLRLSVCGEHAANAASIDFFQKVGIHYLSCSPYNVPIARVAAAQSKIKFSALT